MRFTVRVVFLKLFTSLEVDGFELICLRKSTSLDEDDEAPLEACNKNLCLIQKLSGSN